MARLVLTLIVLLGSYHSQTVLAPPGLVLGLQPAAGDGGDPPRGPARQASANGLRWWVLADRPASDPANWLLPPGVAVALADDRSGGIRAFGSSPIDGPAGMPGFRRRSGGGLFWYESTGAGFAEWADVGRLPERTVVGLKHAVQQPTKVFTWSGRKYDPADPGVAAPQGFRRAAATGFHWYEKIEAAGSPRDAAGVGVQRKVSGAAALSIGSGA